MVIAISLLITYLIALIAAGHDAGPIGYLLVFGDNALWGGRIALAWIALVITLASSLPQSKEHRKKGLQLIAIAILYLSWLSLASMQGRPGWFLTHIALSFPFQVATVVSVSITIYRLSKKTPHNEIKKELGR